VSQCVFCDIVGGTSEASRVYEDDTTLAFMNIKQLSDGHVLVIPKQHIETVDQLPLALAGALFQTTVTIARAVQQTFQPEGMNVWQSNGSAAGQEVPHVHVHIFPRRHDDRFSGFRYETMPPLVERARLDVLALQIRHQIDLDPHSSRSEK
jgi:histidine triad (HIT) family protein